MNIEEHEESFADLFEKSLAGTEALEPGQLIDTTVVSIAGDSVFIQLNGKSEGVLDAAELTDKDGKLGIKEGDSIKAYFLSSKNGEMRFTTRISGDNAGSDVLAKAFEMGIPVEGVVEKEIKGGYEVRIGETRAFCPFSQMGTRRTDNSAEYAGKHLTFKILEYKENGRNILVSNRAILEDEHREQVEVLKKQLREGMVVKGVVKSLQDFGAFVDIDGFQALLPVSEISRSRIDDIRSVLSEGREIEAEIIQLDWKRERMTLSMKSLLADPWDDADVRYPAGSRHKGEVARVAGFGVFVTLEPGLDGLMHISDIEADSQYSGKASSLKKGCSVNVQIKSVSKVDRRISLKPASSLGEDAAAGKYFESGSDSETYNPFAALLKNKKKEE